MNKQMKKELINCDEKCPVETAIDVLAGKWKILILWYLKEVNKKI